MRYMLPLQFKKLTTTNTYFTYVSFVHEQFCFSLSTMYLERLSITLKKDKKLE